MYCCYVSFNIFVASQDTKCKGCLFFFLIFVDLCHVAHRNDTFFQFRDDKN